MNARGTRRPHSRTPRPRKVKISGGGKKGGSCALVLLAMAALPVALLMAGRWVG